MFIDNEGLLCDGQDLTATAASDNHIDTNNIVNRAGEPQKMFLSVDETFDSGGDAATLTITYREDDSPAMASPAVIVTVPIIAEAALVAGAIIDLPPLPRKTLRYLDVNLTVGTENFTSGSLTLGLVMDKQSNGAAAIAEQAALL